MHQSKLISQSPVVISQGPSVSEFAIPRQLTYSESVDASAVFQPVTRGIGNSAGFWVLNFPEICEMEGLLILIDRTVQLFERKPVVCVVGDMGPHRQCVSDWIVNSRSNDQDQLVIRGLPILNGDSVVLDIPDIAGSRQSPVLKLVTQVSVDRALSTVGPIHSVVVVSYFDLINCEGHLFFKSAEDVINIFGKFHLSGELSALFAPFFLVTGVPDGMGLVQLRVQIQELLGTLLGVTRPRNIEILTHFLAAIDTDWVDIWAPTHDHQRAYLIHKYMSRCNKPVPQSVFSLEDVDRLPQLKAFIAWAEMWLIRIPPVFFPKGDAPTVRGG